MALQIISISLSFLALCLSLYTYFKHDAKLKKQNALINQLQLEKLNKEKENAKRAVVEANVINKEKGERLVKVYNKGKTTARNVIIKFPEEAKVFISDYPSPIDIRPQNSIEIVLHTFKESPDVLKLDFEWNDDFKEKNVDSQIIQI